MAISLNYWALSEHYLRNWGHPGFFNTEWLHQHKTRIILNRYTIILISISTVLLSACTSTSENRTSLPSPEHTDTFITTSELPDLTKKDALKSRVVTHMPRFLTQHFRKQIWWPKVTRTIQQSWGTSFMRHLLLIITRSWLLVQTEKPPRLTCRHCIKGCLSTSVNSSTCVV